MSEAPQYTVEQVVGYYLQYREAKAQMADRHKAEMEPINNTMAQLEGWLQAKMQQDGVDSYKTSAGTPYRAVSTSVKMEDGDAFKDFVFDPAADMIWRSMVNAGYPLPPEAKDHILTIIRNNAHWDMIDVRAGKKGIEEYVENQRGELPPGISISTFEKVNVRSA